MRTRWLGRVAFADAHALQMALFRESSEDYLLLLEHPHVFTLGLRAKQEHVLINAEDIGADVLRTNRGGDVTYHGPGQLVGYPILSAPCRTTPEYVHSVEEVIIQTLREFGIEDVGRLPEYPGVWVGIEEGQPRKIAAVGVRYTRGRTMHGFALNVDTDLSYFQHIVPCGIYEYGVTSLKKEGVDVDMRTAVNVVAKHANEMWSNQNDERHDLAWRVNTEDLSAFTRGEGPGEKVVASQPVRMLGRLAQAGVDSTQAVEITQPKPEWLRVKANMGEEFRELKKTMRELNLVTVCEEAGCPNIFECWRDGTATFMVLGERCTRACGFCLVDTRKPYPPDVEEPQHVAEAIKKMQLAHAVITMVARDDLPDGGASHVADVIQSVRDINPQTNIEVLISDMKGDPRSLQSVLDAKPDVFNHNVETVLRLQRAVRPSASYARSLAVLSRAKMSGLKTKSGFMLGLGETDDEVCALLTDLRSIGVDILTIGQYIRPTTNHLPVMKWYTPQEFERYRIIGEQMGFAHVQSSPLTRSSYHARQASESADELMTATASRH
jgi:lipoic acid synthetase